MDYRNRKYYLVNIIYYRYNMRLKYLKNTIPSLKIHKPYSHFISHEDDSHVLAKLGHKIYWQMMISCNEKDADYLECELKKAERDDGCGTRFLELTKELLGQ